ETATCWSALAGLYGAGRGALTTALTDLGTPPLVLCHVSHAYASGASLYFTVGSARRDDPVADWKRVKAAASDAIMDAGGTIRHHHGGGPDHREWLPAHAGQHGVPALRAPKR